MARTTPLSLQDLAAFNDELRALVQARVPLEPSLRALSADVRGRLASMAAVLAERLEMGDSLESAIDDDRLGLPPVYRAVVRAGIRTGDLERALASLSETNQRLQDARRLQSVSFFYPLVVIVLAFCLFLVTLTFFVPTLIEGYESLQYKVDAPLLRLKRLAETSSIWAPITAIVFVAGLGVWWTVGGFARHAYRAQRSWAERWLRLPSLGRIKQAARTVIFTDVMALLVDHQVPLDEGLPIAAQATGDRRLEEEVNDWANQLATGAEISNDKLPRGLPHYLAWIIQQHGPQTANSLGELGDDYRDNLRELIRKYRIMLPVVLTLGLGLTIVLTYLLLFIVPWIDLLMKLATQPK